MCQLDVLQSCLNLPTLRRALKCLPKSLDETYARILCNIPKEHSQDAIKVLQWLTYSARPLRIEELAEIVAIEIEGEPWFDCDAQFPEPREILKVCSGLVALEEGSDVDISSDDAATEDTDPNDADLDGEYHGSTNKTASVVRLAHFSIKEYLISERIQDQPAAEYAIQTASANSAITAHCVAYLLQFNKHDALTSNTTLEFPLAKYAAEYWFHHAHAAGEDINAIRRLSRTLRI